MRSPREVLVPSPRPLAEPPHLGDKLQILATRAPHFLKAVEVIADAWLKELDELAPTTGNRCE